MKKFINILIIASFSMIGCYTTGQVAQPDNNNYSDNYYNEDLSYQTFYDQLQPYGNWVNYPEYGNVWQPNVRDGFMPYETGGHWVSTVDGWAWASDYNWGWAPFHYGRWFYAPTIGWAWVPGYEWAPAWVTWGQYNNYYAWAPLAPGIDISMGNSWRAPSNYWSFVPRSYINSSNLNRYATRNYNANVNNITIINNYNSYNQKDYYHRGPDYQEVQRFTRKPITPVGIASTSQPGSARVVNREFEVFRPSRLGTNGTNRNNISDGNNVNRQITVPNRTRPYNGAVLNDQQSGTGISRPDDRIRRNPALNDVRAGDSKAAASNETRSGNGVSQENIDNMNRRLQQQQMERIYRSRTQSAAGDNSDNPAGVKQMPQSAPQNTQQNNQPNIQRPPVRSYTPAENTRPAQMQPREQDQRVIQRPSFPRQDERIMRQPPSQSPMPQRLESRAPNPARSMQVERPAGPVRRP